MQVIVTIKGINIEADIKKFGKRVIPEYSKGLNRAGQRYMHFLKRMRPVSVKTTGWSAKGMPTDTARMRNSIRKRMLQRLAVGVGPTVKYSKFVHEGARGGKARPFLKWGLQMGARKIIDNEMKKVASRLRS